MSFNNKIIFYSTNYFFFKNFLKNNFFFKKNTLNFINLKISLKRTFRQLFCLPSKGQRTWSNGNTVKKSNYLLSFKVKKFSSLSGKQSNNVFAKSEFILLFYQQQFFPEWYYSFVNLSKLPYFFFKKKKISFDQIICFKISSFYKNPFQKNLKNLTKDDKSINNGLIFGFTL